MPDGPGGFAQDYSCPALLRIPLGHFSLRIRNYHPLWLNFPEHSSHDHCATSWSYNPVCASPHMRFGLFPVRSPLLRESFLFSLPAGTKMFQFPAFASAHIGADDRPSDGRVVPFGNSWIKGHLHLPMTYRSLSRPSSPPGAKASTRRPNSLSPYRCAPCAQLAHTFSCNLLRSSFTYFYAELSFYFFQLEVNLLTVLCHNMSKNSALR